MFQGISFEDRLIVAGAIAFVYLCFLAYQLVRATKVCSDESSPLKTDLKPNKSLADLSFKLTANDFDYRKSCDSYSKYFDKNWLYTDLRPAGQEIPLKEKPMKPESLFTLPIPTKIIERINKEISEYDMNSAYISHNQSPTVRVVVPFIRLYEIIQTDSSLDKSKYIADTHLNHTGTGSEIVNFNKTFVLNIMQEYKKAGWLVKYTKHELIFSYSL